MKPFLSSFVATARAIEKLTCAAACVQSSAWTCWPTGRGLRSVVSASWTVALGLVWERESWALGECRLVQPWTCASSVTSAPSTERAEVCPSVHCSENLWAALAQRKNKMNGTGHVTRPHYVPSKSFRRRHRRRHPLQFYRCIVRIHQCTMLVPPSCRLLNVLHSDLRQVPDNQEIFLAPDSGVSFIVEILERVDEADPIEAIKFSPLFSSPPLLDRWCFSSL